VLVVSFVANAVTTISTNVDTDGNLVVDGTSTLTGLTSMVQASTTGSLTVGDSVIDGLILNGRVSTGNVSGTALTLDDTYTKGEGQELRYKVTDWTNIGDAFRGMYVRAENGVDASTKGVYGMEAYATANDTFDTGTLQGILSYAYLKGTGAKTVGPAYGIHGELSFDAGQSTQTITTEASAGFFRITGGVADTFTKLHGVIIRAGDMDGASRTYGDAILVEDGPESGTITWTRGLKLNAPSTIDIELQNAETISNATDGFISLGGKAIIAGAALGSHLRSTQTTAPTGTTGTCTDDSVSAGSTDMRGEITATCANHGFSYVVATTGITITQTATVGPLVYAYICIE
ncbi:MAG: hypothetical protein UV94_C0023G0009, partial [Parcubacteria group bacterium GW2011_GWC1_43_30]